MSEPMNADTHHSPVRRTGSARLAWSFLRVSAMNELQYRANFFMQLLQSLITLGAGLVGLAVVFGRTTELAGWSRPELLAVMGVFTMVGGILRMIVQPNMERLVEDIQRGTLDYALTKPADAQTLVSVRQLQIWQGVDIIAGMVVLIVAVVQLGDGADGLVRGVAFVVLLLLGSWCIYCFLLMLAASAFWLTRVGEIQELFQGLLRSGQYPVGVYPRWMRYGLTFLVPIGFAVTVPAEAATDRLTVGTVAIAVTSAIVLGLVSRWVWSRGLRRYSGASS
jgi:ABC-2 type transport system permease protein